ncbi:MAG TPA: response regulator transcription factor [Dehalococcoidia bacterium]
MRILIVDDHALVRDGIASLLRAQGYDVVGEAENGLQAIEKARALAPDLVLMDIQMPHLGGLEATRLLKAEMADLRVVILTVSDGEQDLFDAIKSGASGYLLKDLEQEEFFDSLRAVERGEAVIPRRLAGHILDEFRALSTERNSTHLYLSEREREILRMVAAGKTRKEMALALHLSESAIKFHMRKILDKLHLQNRAQVVAWAVQHGLSPQETAASPPD